MAVDRYLLKYNSKIISGNRIFLSFDISLNSQGTFDVHLYNPVASGVAISLDLLSDQAQLLHLNEPNIHRIPANSSKIFEAYGLKDNFLYVDLKLCFGKVDFSFYESDYNKIKKKAFFNYETIKNNI